MSGLTELSVAALIARAQGIKSNPAKLGVVAAAAGRLARALALAEVTPGGAPELAGLRPLMLHEVGRALVLRGEALFVIEVRGGRVELIPAGHWDVSGTARRWVYRCDLAGPSGSETVTRPAEAVLHFRINAEASEPWRGRSMLEVADSSAKLTAALEESLATEAENPTLLLVPAPSEGQDGSDDKDKEGDSLSQLRADIVANEGRISLVPSMNTGWGDGRGGAPPADWKQVRIGASPPRPVVSLRKDSEDSLLGALAVPPDLVRGGGEGSANREAARQHYHSAVLAVAELLVEEVRAKLHPDASMTFDRLGAADVQGRARAFGSMTRKDDKLPTEEAARLAGLRQ